MLSALVLSNMVAIAASSLCSAHKPSNIEDGHEDKYRGWYDVTGCGECNDYCRWIGSASGGDPSVSVKVAGATWSCRMAGDSEVTVRIGFPSFPYTKCAPKPDYTSSRPTPSACRWTDKIPEEFELGLSPHSLVMYIESPGQQVSKEARVGRDRQWILNLGQRGTGAEHWLWNYHNADNTDRIQFGRWNGAQVGGKQHIAKARTLATTWDGDIIRVYVDGVLAGEKKTKINVTTRDLYVGVKRLTESDYSGCVSSVDFFQRALTSDEIGATAISHVQTIGGSDLFPSVASHVQTIGGSDLFPSVA